MSITISGDTGISPVTPTGTSALVDGLTVGRGSGEVSTNTAVGYQAAYSNTTGATNVLLGMYAGYYNQTGSQNTAVGYGSLSSSGNGSSTANTAVGFQTLQSNTTGGSNVAVGQNALQANTTASNNTAVGYQAAYTQSTATRNTSIGYQAGYTTNDSYNVFVGWSAGKLNTGNSNVVVGDNALASSGAGSAIVAVGQGALGGNTSGTYNTAVGYNVAVNNTSGAYNTAFGGGALSSNTTASNNTAVGYQAGYSNTTGPSNVFVGYQAGYSNQSQNYSTFIGFQAGYTSVATQTFTWNTCVGAQSGYSLTTGYRNTFIGGGQAGGYGAGYYVTTGNNNTIVGAYNGNQGGLDIRTTSNYIVLSDGDGNPRGYFDSAGLLRIAGDTGVNRHQIWQVNAGAYSMTVGSLNATAANCYGLQILYNNAAPNGTSNEFLQCQDNAATRAYIRSNGGLSNYSANNTNLSDERTKTDIQDAGSYLSKICAIPVRTFKYKDQTDDLLNLGVIAQEVEAVAPELVDVSGFGETPEDGIPLKSIYQTDLQYALMKALQELKAEFDLYKEAHP